MGEFRKANVNPSKFWREITSTLPIKQDAPEAIISAQLSVKNSYVAHLVAQSIEIFLDCNGNIISIAKNNRILLAQRMYFLNTFKNSMSPQTTKLQRCLYCHGNNFQ